MVESISLLLDSFLPPDRCAKAKFRAGKIVSQFEREQAVTTAFMRSRGFFAGAERSAAERLACLTAKPERAGGAPSPSR
jgi:hypothetical protein